MNFLSRLGNFRESFTFFSRVRKKCKILAINFYNVSKLSLTVKLKTEIVRIKNYNKLLKFPFWSLQTMKIFIAVLFGVLLVASLPVIKPTEYGSHNYRNERLVVNITVEKEKSWIPYTKTELVETFTAPRGHLINYVAATDYYHNNATDVSLIDGGIDYSFVTLKFKTKSRVSIKYLVKVYARKATEFEVTNGNYWD